MKRRHRLDIHLRPPRSTRHLRRRPRRERRSHNNPRLRRRRGRPRNASTATSRCPPGRRSAPDAAGSTNDKRAMLEQTSARVDECTSGRGTKRDPVALAHSPTRSLAHSSTRSLVASSARSLHEPFAVRHPLQALYPRLYRRMGREQVDEKAAGERINDEER